MKNFDGFAHKNGYAEDFKKMEKVIEFAMNNLSGEDRRKRIEKTIEILCFVSAQLCHINKQLTHLISRVARSSSQMNWYCDKHLVDNEHGESYRNRYEKVRENQNRIHNAKVGVDKIIDRLNLTLFLDYDENCGFELVMAVCEHCSFPVNPNYGPIHPYCDILMKL